MRLNPHLGTRTKTFAFTERKYRFYIGLGVTYDSSVLFNFIFKTFIFSIGVITNHMWRRE
jgi:hypothetical protein